MREPAGNGSARRLPGLTSGQSAQLRRVLETRLNARTAGSIATHGPAEDEPIEDQPVADRSLMFAFHHAIGCLRQDRPWLLYAGTLGLAYSGLVVLYAVVQAAVAAR